MQIHTTAARIVFLRQVENGAWQNLPVGNNGNRIRLHFAKLSEKACIARLFRLCDRNAVGQRILFHRWRQKFMTASSRFIGLGHSKDDIVLRTQNFQRRHRQRRRAHKNNFQKQNPAGNYNPRGVWF